MQVAYCENEGDCRRVVLLSYLGEQDFDRNRCAQTCDNCRQEGEYTPIDNSEHARKSAQP